MLVGVPSIMVKAVWQSVRPFIVRSLEETGEYRFDADDILERLLATDMQLWVDGAPLQIVVVTEIYRHPKATELSIGPIAGKLPEDWESSLKMLEDWGKDIGCTHVGTLGRSGWSRKLGWRNAATYCMKEL